MKKLKRIKWENIYLTFILIQLVDWFFKNALSIECIIYYVFVIIIYFTIKYLRKYEED